MSILDASQALAYGVSAASSLTLAVVRNDSAAAFGASDASATASVVRPMLADSYAVSEVAASFLIVRYVDASCSAASFASDASVAVEKRVDALASPEAFAFDLPSYLELRSEGEATDAAAEMATLEVRFYDVAPELVIRDWTPDMRKRPRLRMRWSFWRR